MKHVLLIFTLFCATCITVKAQTNTWTGAGGNQSWNSAANWSMGQVPTAAHDVVIPTGVNISINVPAAVKSVAIQGNSILNLSNNLSIVNASSIAANATVNWTSSNLIGGGNLINNGTINLVSANSRYIIGGTTLTNNGTVTMPDAGYLYLYDTSVFNNTASGVFDIQSNAVITYSEANHSFNNAGLLKKSGSAGNATFAAILVNTGTISVENGNLLMTHLPKTFTNGVYNVSTDNQLMLNSPINMSGTLTGELDGALTWNNNVSVPSTVTFDFTGDTQVHWNSGSLLGGGTLTNECTIQMTSAGSRYISAGTTFINNSLVTMPGAGYLYLYDTSVFNNTSDGVFDIQSNAVITYSEANHSFNNAGLLKKSGSDGNATFAALLLNTGTVSVESGDLLMNNLQKTFTHGVYNVSTDNQLVLNSPINVSGTLTGELDGALAWNGNVSVASAVTFDFTGDTQVHWNSGSLLGGGTLTNECTIQMTSAGSRYISAGTTFINTSLVTMPGAGYFYLYDTSVFNNTASGVFDIQSDAVITYSEANHSFINVGLLKKSGSDGNATFSAKLVNTGTISVENGNLLMGNLPKTFTNGVYNVNTGSQLVLNNTINVSGTLTGELDGAMVWNENVSVASTATFEFTGDTQVNWNSGILLGGGTLTNECTIQMTGASSRYVTSATTLINNSVVTMPGAGYFYLYDTSIFNNTSSGVFDIQSNAVISYSETDHTFNNAGLLKKSGSDGNATFSSLLVNTGTISVENGNLLMGSLQKTFTNGIYNVNTGSQLVLNNTISASGTLTGTLDGPLVWNSDVLVDTTATFDFIGDAGIHWHSGNLEGGGTLTNEGDIYMMGAGSRYIVGTVTTLSNAGTINFVTGGFLYLYDSTTLHNQASGIIDLQSDATISHSGSGAYSINNEGLFQKTGNTGVSVISPPVINSGIINITSGELEFLDSAGLNNTVNGIIKGTATINLPSAANFANAGTFAPGGSPGTLTALGTYKSSGTSILEIEINGLTPGTGYDVLALTGTNAIFEGNVNVTLGFAANVNDEFIVATTTGPISQCNLATTTTAEYNDMTYTFDVFCRNDNQVVLKLVNVTLGVHGYELTDASIQLYPNPVRNKVTIKNRGQMELVNGAIVDLTGKTISTFDLHDMGLTKEISLEQYSSGIYFLKINGMSGSITKRIVKQ